MNRIRVLAIGSTVLLLTLAGLAACVKLFVSPTPFPNDSFVQTSVYSTLTALAAPSSTPTQTAEFNQIATLSASATPHDFIYYYFANINARNYNLTWSLLTDRFKARLNGPAQGGFAGYISYWNSVQRVTVVNAFYACAEDFCSVNTTLTFQYADGTTDTSLINYAVIFDPALQTWMFEYIPAPTATASRTFTATLTPTRTTTFTPTRTSTATSTSTATGTFTQTFTRTASPTSTPTYSPTASQTPTATSTATFSPTSTVTYTPTETLTPTITQTPTDTPTSTETLTPIATNTETQTPTLTETTSP